ncbi:hypothetical protein Tdes44962_MAKER09692 [Teratosphaeria destructans]|uniref:Uncharacterized protein n=1 Tax=Teratosphaeria destructans TaxID=418781 RepID=A0A9W7W243_9PEZI|nr:hypothetical protein Tdes44962_MAKER09692 [Teratosphaeria destructans]
MSNIVETAGYYWMNASWGVSSFVATFAHMDEGQLKKTNNLSDVTKMLSGKSSLALATVAISLTCPSKLEGDRQVPDRTSYGLSVKIHNAFGVDVVDFHGPPQQGSTGMIIPSRFITGAKSIRSTGGALGGSGNFANIGTIMIVTTDISLDMPTDVILDVDAHVPGSKDLLIPSGNNQPWIFRLCLCAGFRPGSGGGIGAVDAPLPLSIVALDIDVSPFARNGNILLPHNDLNLE